MDPWTSIYYRESSVPEYNGVSTGVDRKEWDSRNRRHRKSRDVETESPLGQVSRPCFLYSRFRLRFAHSLFVD